jgi:inner membrane protein
MSIVTGMNPLLLKLLLIVALSIILMIPLRQVESLIAERASLRDSTVERVAKGVGHAQYIGSVIMNVPVTRSWSEGGKTRMATKNYRVLADSVDIVGSVSTAVRRSGIYEVPTFQAHLHAVGSIGDEFPTKELAVEPGVIKTVGNITLFLAIADPAGIRGLEGIHVGDRVVPVTAGIEAGLKGVVADVGAIDIAGSPHLSFAVDLDIAGTERLQFYPLARTTHVSLTSPWPSPSFSGAFSPDVAPQVRAHGFAADWRVLQINRDYPQLWTDGEVTGAQISQSAFGVDFYQPVDIYQRDYRAIHYAALFIALTFMALFLWEHTLGKPVHAVQYAMLGAALAVFYLVLVALSEHVPFGESYTLAAAAMSLLLAVYFSGVLLSRLAGLAAAVITATCYSLLYLLVLSEEYALLFGTLALFAVLAGTMVATRKFNWYRVTESHRDAG